MMRTDDKEKKEEKGVRENPRPSIKEEKIIIE